MRASSPASTKFPTVAGTQDIHPTGAQMEAIYRLAPPALRKTMVAGYGHDLNVIFLARSNELSTLQPMIDKLVKDNPPPPGITVAAGGIGVVGVGLLHNLDESRTLMTYLAIVFVGAFLAVRLQLSSVRSCPWCPCSWPSVPCRSSRSPSTSS